MITVDGKYTGLFSDGAPPTEIVLTKIILTKLPLLFANVNKKKHVDVIWIHIIYIQRALQGSSSHTFIAKLAMCIVFQTSKDAKPQEFRREESQWVISIGDSDFVGIFCNTPNSMDHFGSVCP